MVKLLRITLYPFALLYGAITKLRNWAFDFGIFKSTSFDIPLVVVGNLNVGGTGKSPQIEYIIRLLQNKYKIAVLSRGYKRKSKGFQMASEKTTVEQIGDEPLQFYRKFKNIVVAVDADRVNGINQLINIASPPQIILLDDAFQHRNVKAGLNILLTSYNKLYADDYMLPTGDLRENRSGAKRAHIIVVSKCPENISTKEQDIIIEKLKPTKTQTVFFSAIKYDDRVLSGTKEISVSKLHEFEVLLVTGIANPEPLLNFLRDKNIKFNHLKYPDHYNFSERDLKNVFFEFEKIKNQNKIILTTEKDYVRAFSKDNNKVYYLPIRTDILGSDSDFNKIILDYVQ